jgi:hypothetical protein
LKQLLLSAYRQLFRNRISNKTLKEVHRLMHPDNRVRAATPPQETAKPAEI